ncbi:MAG: GTP-binding protein [Propionibacterium sp.]|nr:GTP-binding protein [Propionibacterium sp.]
MLSISVLSTTVPLLRDMACLCAGDEVDTLTCDLTEDSVFLRFAPRGGEGWEREIPLAHPCLTCSLREAVVPALADLAAQGRDGLLLALPPAVEPLSVLPTLNDLTAPGEVLELCTLTTSVHAVDLGTARADLLEHVALAERGLALFEGDDRCTGEVLMTSLGYADILLAIGEDTLGSDLVEHLRPFDTMRLDHLDELTRDVLLCAHHDADRAITRVHPAHTSAWGGPTAHGVWTLDLHSDRPFHPTRLGERAGELSLPGTCVRGCFWLPSRPDTICTWEVNGGSATVGTAGGWEDCAFTHLIVTGVGDPAQRSAIETSFSELLMSESELHDALAWVGADDGLADWFPGED